MKDKPEVFNLRTWLRKTPRPVAVLADDKRIEVGKHGRSWKELTTTIEALDLDQTRVRDVMTPIVFSVAPTTPARKVVDQLLKQGVHRLYVVDDGGVLVGIVSTIDIVRRLN